MCVCVSRLIVSCRQMLMNCSRVLAAFERFLRHLRTFKSHTEAVWLPRWTGLWVGFLLQ